MTPEVKLKRWSEESLQGTWLITKKIDGVQAIRTKNGWCSRKNKPLHNIPTHAAEVVEVYLGSWEASVSACRTHNGSTIKKQDLYSLRPLDPRLVMCEISNPTAEHIRALMEGVVADGGEGLVLWKDGEGLKVKPSETFDVPVTAVIPGKGRHVGRMGALMTPMGKVGTGFTDKQRRFRWDLGTIIEVECMATTPSGKFRHPRFVRIREDK